jgi:hypothetical protein
MDSCAEFTFPDGSKKICTHGSWHSICLAGGFQNGWHQFSERAAFIIDGEILACIELPEGVKGYISYPNHRSLMFGEATKDFVERFLRLGAFE